MRNTSPLAAAAAGFFAGLVGAAAQSAFFALTKKITPKPPEGAFEPPEPEQKEEGSPETVARRLVEDLMQRGPLGPKQKKVAGQLVHFGFGGAWGALYGMIRESAPGMRRPLPAAGYGVLVWVMGDDVILPLFRLAAPATRYPPKSHAYAIAAHVVYSGAVAATYEGIRRVLPR